MHFWKALQLQEGKIPRCMVTTSSFFWNGLVQTLCSFNTTVINVRSPLQGQLVLKVDLMRFLFQYTILKMTLPWCRHINYCFINRKISKFDSVLPCSAQKCIVKKKCIAFVVIYFWKWISLVAQWKRATCQWWRICLPMQEMQVQSLGWEDPLEEGMTTNSSILAWRIQWTEQPDMLRPMMSWGRRNLATKQSPPILKIETNSLEQKI